MLDYQNILDDKPIQNLEKRRLKAGSRIEPRFHGFLLTNPTQTFNEGEWVGFEMADNDGNGNDCSGNDYCQTYILARILYEVKSDLKNSEQNFTTMYMVDIGDEEPLVIGAHELYKFCRPNVDWPLELSEDSTDIEEDSDLPENVAEAQREIDEVLKNLLPLSQDQRRKIIKRLYLRWHPDKNPGKEELCNEVFKYLKRKMLEIDSNVEKENIMPGQSYSNFSNFFYQWDFQARFQKEQRKERARHTQPGANVIKLFMALTYECL
jgi:sacsin